MSNQYSHPSSEKNLIFQVQIAFQLRFSSVSAHLRVSFGRRDYLAQSCWPSRILDQWATGPTHWFFVCVKIPSEGLFRVSPDEISLLTLGQHWANTGQTLGQHSAFILFWGRNPTETQQKPKKTQKISQPRGSFGRCISYARRSRKWTGTQRSSMSSTSSEQPLHVFWMVKKAVPSLLPR